MFSIETNVKVFSTNKEVRNLCEAEPKIQPSGPCAYRRQDDVRRAHSQQGHHTILPQNPSRLARIQSIALQDAGRGLVTV